jgi:hypothetical protein
MKQTELFLVNDTFSAPIKTVKRKSAMRDNDKKSWPNDDILPQPTPEALRGRQSVRATFKLSAKAIEAMSVVAVHLGIKQKSLFDHLIDDVDSLRVIAQEMESRKFSAIRRIQKTFVISRKTLSCLDETSKRFNAPRDALVEYSIQRLLPVITRERERHRRRKQMMDEMNTYLESGLGILKKSKKLLGEDDPVFLKLESAMRTLVNTQRNMQAFVEKGNIIEEF